MPELPSDAVEVEKLVRALLVKLFSGITGLPKVYGSRLYIDGAGQAVEKIGYTHPATKKIEYRVLLIDLSHPEDTDGGCEDDPVYFLTYTVKLVVQHNDARPDGSTSTDDYARFVMTMRRRVMMNRHLAFAPEGAYPKLDCKNLKPLDRTIYGKDDETLIYGHTGEFELKVEVTP